MSELDKSMKPGRAALWLGALAAAGVGALSAASPAAAHHSFAMYDRARTVTLEGTVKDWQFANPHSQLVMVVLENGTPVEYNVEGASVNTLVRIGWGPKTFKAGDKISVVMNPLRDGSKAGAFLRATRADGKTLSAGQTPN
ncbi:MAG: hypothetical protein JWO72_1498 [Caulobacteraceae bacterium]|nr:hypothetical protein [Caulobacteraceae bacterium]